MKKTLKKVLFFTDGISESHLETLKILCEPGDYYFTNKDNYLAFKFYLTTELKCIETTNVDVICIDYGLLHSGTMVTNRYIPELKRAIKILEKAYCSGIRLAWVGGMAHRNNKDAKGLFPEHEFLHNLPWAYMHHESILNLLYRVLKEKS
jgi:hypothetical protein